jgi:hypothetical protein
MFEFFITNFLLSFWPSLTPRHEKSFLGRSLMYCAKSGGPLRAKCEKIKECLYKARWRMADHAQMLREQGLPVPKPNPNPTITIQNEPKLPTARSAIFSDRCADCRPAFRHSRA